jgi:hypothetical protein
MADANKMGVCASAVRRTLLERGLRPETLYPDFGHWAWGLGPFLPAARRLTTENQKSLMNPEPLET